MIMASVLVYHVVGDLTVGKPDLVEFPETETVESAIKAIGESTEGGICVWKKRPQKGAFENSEARQQRFLGILTSLDIVAFLSQDWCLEDHEKAIKTPVSEIVVHNNSLLKQVDPATRLIDTLEIIKQGVKRLLVPKCGAWKCVSKKFSVLYNGRWLKNMDSSTTALARPPTATSSTTTTTKFCCLSREDVTRFLIGCLGALAPIPLTPISTLGAISPHFHSIEATLPAAHSARRAPRDPHAVAVVEPSPDGRGEKIIGEISASKLWKCDYLAAAHTLSTLSAGQFVMGVEENNATSSRSSTHDLEINPAAAVVGGGPPRPKKFSSRSIGFFSSAASPSQQGTGPGGRTLYRGRSAPLTCKDTNSLAAVMAQMLSHRATHVWVTEGEDDVLVGVVGYGEILHAVTRPRSVAPSS